jgi:hypothetical protein
MTWLALAYFLSLGTLNGQQLTSPDFITFQTLPLTFQTTFGIEAQLFNNHLFAGGSVQTWESALDGGFFAPNEGIYIFSAGLRWEGLEIGYRHECDHPIVSRADFQISQGILSSRDEIYLSYKGTLKIF